LASVIVIGAVLALLLGSSFPPAQAGANYSPEEIALVRLLNDYRASHGLRPVLISDQISEACDRHSSDMAEYGFVEHYTTNGSDWFEVGASPWDRMAASGYSYQTAKGENLAAGQADAAAVLAAWKNSPAHDAVMLNPTFGVIGVSLVQVEGSSFGYYWTADFGGYVDPAAHAVDALGPAAQ
jgi:uncharacterized protein YkwD